MSGSPDIFGIPISILCMRLDNLAAGDSRSVYSLYQLFNGMWVKRFSDPMIHFQTWNRRLPAYAELESGALIALHRGLLFVPKKEEASQVAVPARILDWKVGFPLIGAAQIISRGGDRFAVVSRSGSSPRWVNGDLSEFEKKSEPIGVEGNCHARGLEP
jgi:hypothetical protein